MRTQQPAPEEREHHHDGHGSRHPTATPPPSVEESVYEQAEHAGTAGPDAADPPLAEGKSEPAMNEEKQMPDKTAHSEPQPTDEPVDEPVLEGAGDHSEDDIDPRKGMTDPALIRDIDSGKKTANPYG